MDKNTIQNFISILGYHGTKEYNPVKQWLVKRKLIRFGKTYIDELLTALDSNNQEIVMNVAEILGLVGDERAIPKLKNVAQKDDLWGATACNVGVALIRLGDEDGALFLKNKIQDPDTHRDLRLEAANALIKLHKRNIFKKHEKINFSGDSMTDAWSTSLKKLVAKLREK